MLGLLLLLSGQSSRRIVDERISLMNRILKFSVLILGIVLVSACAPENDTGHQTDDGAAVPGDLNGNGEMDVYENPALPIADRIDDILTRMSRDQKVRLVSGSGWSQEGCDTDVDKVPGAAGNTIELENLGIPSIILADGPAGLRICPTRKGGDGTYYATAFPIETLLASTWDVQLVEKVGVAMGNEVKEYGVDILLAPGMNIHRDPRGGRNFEYYSEDPHLNGHLAAAMVNGVESVGVGATLKHYVANNQETNRYLVDTIVSERALREIYLRGFEIAVREARPWAIMSAYNQVNGNPASHDKALLTTVLRDEWDFDGVVMTDWFAGMNDTVAQMRAGNELLMPGTEEGTAQITQALEAGQLDESVLDRNIRYILGIILQSPSFARYDYGDKPNLEAHSKTARRAAADGVVLLKNDDRTLPLTADVETIAAFGNTSYDFLSGGTGSGDVNEAYTVSMVQGLEARGFGIDNDLRNLYETYIQAEKAKWPAKRNFWEFRPPPPEMVISEGLIADKAIETDIALVTIGRNSGEFQDRPLEGDFYLTAEEKALIAKVSAAFHAQEKKVVLILNIGNVVESMSWRDNIDAIVLPWQGGQEAGNALVDVLTGNVNPSGKLPTTFPVEYSDTPSSDNFPGVNTSDEIIDILGIFKSSPSRVDYEEGIYVGYRYYDTFDVEPAYEFGYGLSYTSFDYGPCRLSADTFADSMTVTVSVTNSGNVSGKEVVQLYLTAPEGDLHKPARELKGFAKTSALKPGESQVLEFTLRAKDLASFYDDRSAWIADTGTYEVSIGASSRDIKSTVTFELGDELVVEHVVAELSPKIELEEISP
jgi:beta-glucosidase